MTRKRKLMRDEGSTSASFNSDAVDHTETNVHGGPMNFRHNRAPSDMDEISYSENQKRCNFIKNQFEKEYGYLNKSSTSQYERNEIRYYTAESVNQDERRFPVEMIRYLKGIANSMKESPEMVGIIRSKCLTECSGMEEVLLDYNESCRLLETIFTGFREASLKWFQVVMKLKRKRQLELLYRGFSSHALESFLNSLCPSDDEEIVSHFVEVVMNDWNDFVVNPAGSHFVRSLVRLLCGVKQSSGIVGKGSTGRTLSISQNFSTVVKHEMKSHFLSLAALAFDYNSMKDYLDDVSVSYVLQDFVACETVMRTNATNRFVSSAVNDIDYVLASCRGKNSSLVWQKIAEECDEDTLSMLYTSIFEGHLSEMVEDPFANYVVLALMHNGKSEELKVNIFDELVKDVKALCELGKWRVVVGLISIASSIPTFEKSVIQELRGFFKCASKSSKRLFIPNVLTMNNVETVEGQEDGLTFNMNMCTLHGSLILQALCSFEHNKTLLFSFHSLSKKCIANMCYQKNAVYFLEAFLNSDHIDAGSKRLIPEVFDKFGWIKAICHPLASHIFECIWNSSWFTIDERIEIMQLLNRSDKNKKGLWRIMITKLGQNLFNENRTKWLKEEKARLRIGTSTR